LTVCNDALPCKTKKLRKATQRKADSRDIRLPKMVMPQSEVWLVNRSFVLCKGRNIFFDAAFAEAALRSK